jgi:predicted RNA-binding Zn-ribbon protein involved in translation (DUF1610 family)
MKKTITFTEDVLVCDRCGQEVNLANRVHVKKCAICGADVCTLCSVHDQHEDITICKKHINYND